MKVCNAEDLWFKTQETSTEIKRWDHIMFKLMMEDYEEEENSRKKDPY